MDDLLREFVGETLDMMEAVAGDLVAWEADPSDRSGLDRIFRTIHTVKGSSGFFEIPRISAIAHAAEDMLDVLRNRKGAPSRASVATVLAAFDRIRELTQAIAATGQEPAGEDFRLIAAILADVRSEDRDGLPDIALPTDPALLPDRLDGLTDITGPADVPTAWRSVRVPVDLLDELMSGVSDLVLARNEVAAQLRAHGIDPVELAAFERLSQLLVAVRGSVSHMRMVPLRHLYSPLPRMVRQVADELGKDVRLILAGSEVEIDREVIEALRDPVMHLLRNAIDHGFESADARIAAGKDAVGQLDMSARQAGNRILISLTDDGAGLALDRLVERAMRVGHLKAAQAASLNDAQKAELVFLPGLSTADQVTGISGRGVGMDVVKANVERLGGAIQIANRPGHGVTLTLDVPMTLTIISALAIDVGDQSFAIPRSAVDEVMLASSDVVQRHITAGAGLARVRGRVLPMLVIEDVLGLPRGDISDSDERAIILCRIGGGQRLALDVPSVRDHEELVIKPLPPVLLALGLYNGLSLPDNGRPMLVLDVDGIGQRHVIADVDAMAGSDGDGMTPAATNDNLEPWLSFTREIGGTLSAVAMATVERISDIDVTLISRSGGRVIAHVDNVMVPVVTDGFDLPSDGKVRMVRLGDGHRVVMLPVAEISHILNLAPEILPVDGDCGLIGMSMFNGELVEMIDSYGLLARHGRTVGGSRAVGGVDPSQADDAEGRLRPLWIVDPAGGEWAGGFLVPSLAAAGYQVTIVSHRDAVSADATVVLTMAPNGPSQPIKVEADGTVHQLSAYDRAALLTLIDEAKASPRKRAGHKAKGTGA